MLLLKTDIALSYIAPLAFKADSRRQLLFIYFALPLPCVDYLHWSIVFATVVTLKPGHKMQNVSHFLQLDVSIDQWTDYQALLICPAFAFKADFANNPHFSITCYESNANKHD